MNILFHFLFNYLIINALLGNAFDYIIPIFIFSIALDLDHIPYLLKHSRSIVKKKFGSESRTRFHELYGLTLFSILVAALFPFFELKLIKIVALSLVLHYAIDFLIGKTRPFFPFSKKEVFLHLSPEKKYKIPFEIVLTLIVGVLWLAVIS